MGNYATCDCQMGEEEEFEVSELLAIERRLYSVEDIQANFYQENIMAEALDQNDTDIAPQALCLLVIGAVGSEKTLAINYIANFFECGWLGNLKVVVPTASMEVNVAVFSSRSEKECTVYQFKHNKYPLTIIDTPEFSGSNLIDARRIGDIEATVGPISGVLLVVNMADSSQIGEIQHATGSLLESIPGLCNSKLIIAYSNAATRGSGQLVVGYEPAFAFELPESPFSVTDFQALPILEKIDHYVQWVTLMHHIRQVMRVLKGQPQLPEITGFDMDYLLELFEEEEVHITNHRIITRETEAPVTIRENEASVTIRESEAPATIRESEAPVSILESEAPVSIEGVSFTINALSEPYVSPTPLPFTNPNCSTLLLLSEDSREKVVFLNNFAQSTLQASPLCEEVIKLIAIDPTAEFTLRDEVILAKGENNQITGCTKFYFCTHQQTHVVISAPEIRKVEDDFADPEYVSFLALEILGVGVLRSVVFAVSEQNQYQKLPGNITRMLDDVTKDAPVVVTAVVVPPKAERMLMTCENPEVVRPMIKMLVSRKDWAAADKVFKGIIKVQELLPPVKVTLVNPNMQRKEKLKAELFQITEHLSKSQLIVDSTMRLLKAQDEAEKARQEHPSASVPASMPALNPIVSVQNSVETPYHNTLCKFAGCTQRVCHKKCRLSYIKEEGSNKFLKCKCMTNDTCHECDHGYQWHLHACYLKEQKITTFEEVLRERNIAMQVEHQSQREETMAVLAEERGKLAAAKQSLLDNFKELRKISVSGAFFSQEVNEMYQILLNTHRKLGDTEVRRESDLFLTEVKRIIRAASFI